MDDVLMILKETASDREGFGKSIQLPKLNILHDAWIMNSWLDIYNYTLYNT